MAGPPVRESYNAKARGSTAGSRKKGKPKKKSKSEQLEQQDPNAAILTQKSQEDKDKERKEKLLQEVCFSVMKNCFIIKHLACSSLVNQSPNGRAKKRNVWRSIL
jgi:hypothetical protein